MLVGIAALTGAQVPAADSAACAAIANDQGRLACYDRASAAAGPVAKKTHSGKSQPLMAPPAKTLAATPAESEP